MNNKQYRAPRGALSTARYRLTCAQYRVERLQYQLEDDHALIAQLSADIKQLERKEP